MKTKNLSLHAFIFIAIIAFINQAWTTQKAQPKIAKAITYSVNLCALKPSTDTKIEEIYYISTSEILIMDSFCIKTNDTNAVWIKSYNMTTLPQVGNMENIQIAKNSFQGVVKTLLQKLKPGDLFVIDRITLVNSLGKETILEPISVRVRE